jgi:hypothetical protein
MQVQVGKLPIVTSYCLWFLAKPEMILYILPYMGEGTLVGGKMFAKITHLASHLFCS